MRIFRFPPPFLEEIPFLEGDMLFLAQGVAGGLCPFEHVAIVLKTQSANSASGIADVSIYALPESIDKGFSLGLWQTTARVYWLKHTKESVRDAIHHGHLGDPISGWNAGWRATLTADQRRYMRTQSMMAIGAFKYAYQPGARVERPAADTVRTNCVGFVRWIYRHVAKVDLVEDSFPEYVCPFGTRENRAFASPGHLARAADLPPESLPYKPTNKLQAEREALV